MAEVRSALEASEFCCERGQKLSPILASHNCAHFDPNTGRPRIRNYSQYRQDLSKTGLNLSTYFGYHDAHEMARRAGKPVYFRPFWELL